MSVEPKLEFVAGTALSPNMEVAGDKRGTESAQPI